MGAGSKDADDVNGLVNIHLMQLLAIPSSVSLLCLSLSHYLLCSNVSWKGSLRDLQNAVHKNANAPRNARLGMGQKFSPLHILKGNLPASLFPNQ